MIVRARQLENTRGTLTTQYAKQASQGLTEIELTVMQLAWMCLCVIGHLQTYCGCGFCGTPDHGSRIVFHSFACSFPKGNGEVVSLGMQRWRRYWRKGRSYVWEKKINEIKKQNKIIYIVGMTLNLLDKLLLFVKSYYDMCPDYDYSFENMLTIDRF